MSVWVVASIAALALTVLPGHAKAASPVLEFVAPPSAFPIHFTADGGEVTAALTEFGSIVHCEGSHGEGVIAGPRSAFSRYFFTECEAEGGGHAGQECVTPSANPEEIQSEFIEAELVYIDQAKHEVGMLLNPQEDTYISFECGGELVEGFGSFLSPVGPLNQLTTSFTATLTRSGATQIPSEYENANGEKLQAIPMGEREGHPAATTGVELGFTIQTDASLEIKALTAAEVEAKQRQEEEAAAKKRQEEEAATKKRQEEEAARKRQEEEQAKKALRARQLSKALKRCRKLTSKHKRIQCEHRAKKRYGGHKKNGIPPAPLHKMTAY